MMDRILNNKWSIRIISLLLAAILFVSVNINNGNDEFRTLTQQDTEVVQNVPVKVYYDNTNLYVSGMPDTVSVTLSGPRSLVQSAKAQQDFIVYVDLRNASIGEQTVKLRVKNLSERLKAVINPETVKVNVQEKVTKKFSVDAELGKSTIAEGYQADTTTVEPRKVAITGAKDTMKQIAYVKATVEGNDKHEEDFSTSATVAAFDKNLNKLDVQISPEKVKVDVSVSKVGKSIPIKIKEQGTPKSDLSISSVTPDRENVIVVGDGQELDKIKVIEIPVDVSKITADTVKEITVPVPSGARAVQPTSIEVKIKTTKKTKDNDSSQKEESSKKKDTTMNNNDASSNKNNSNNTFAQASRTLSNVDVYTSGLSDGYEAQMITPASGKVNVTLQGPSIILNTMNTSSISLIANLAAAREGSYSTNIEAHNVPDKISYRLSEKVAEFAITRKNT
ncbi:YbbR-like domain-containing protein [Listeria sp. PSOL-1]|uniref:CdaR family protein n=1 Tax=Listeria sp. PSOL-1 TaxID=1844999 RepID=UPI0013D5A6E3|nr:CdaR family protein [Listeria sp. PSOL-1]